MALTLCSHSPPSTGRDRPGTNFISEEMYTHKSHIVIRYTHIYATTYNTHVDTHTHTHTHSTHRYTCTASHMHAYIQKCVLTSVPPLSSTVACFASESCSSRSVSSPCSQSRAQHGHITLNAVLTAMNS